MKIKLKIMVGIDINRICCFREFFINNLSFCICAYIGNAIFEILSVISENAIDVYKRQVM